MTTTFDSISALRQSAEPLFAHPDSFGSVIPGLLAGTAAKNQLPAWHTAIMQDSQMLALAVGAQTAKMHQGHHGANHPVKDFTTGKVEIVSMNHGFAVDRDSLPKNAVETHVSLFDGSNCGIALKDKPAFSVQHHPEASPGPQDSHYLFDRFVTMMETKAPVA